MDSVMAEYMFHKGFYTPVSPKVYKRIYNPTTNTVEITRVVGYYLGQPILRTFTYNKVQM